MNRESDNSSPKNHIARPHTGSPRPRGGEPGGERRDPERIAFARQQRKQANDFAKGVWEMIRGRRILDQKFRREYPFGPYTLDFVCLDLKLIIEVDGKDHLTDDGKQHDLQRDDYVREQGFEVLRIPGFHVTQNPNEVRQQIEDVVRRRITEIQVQGPGVRATP